MIEMVQYISLTPAQMYHNWCEFKMNEGWRYGEFKDEESKTHPCLVPYDELSKEQQQKDIIFQETVREVFEKPSYTASPARTALKPVNELAGFTTLSQIITNMT